MKSEVCFSGRAVPCNDSVACADGSTCCKSVRGEWACCPLPEAVCCEDHLHCCPHGTVCNLEAQTCDHSSGGPVTPLLPNTPVFPLPAENRKCEESTSCPGNWTCCQAAGGRWACCPLPQFETWTLFEADFRSTPGPHPVHLEVHTWTSS
uniref:Granulins domain-containing protein n=1 Tax=Kryptolebias marmoratus TaxID=37003 RepID=A0A3Q3B2D5_KRYMA